MSDDTSEIETRIDEAWAVRAEDEATDEDAARFIDVLLAEALLCPVWGEPDAAAAEDAELSPKLIDLGGRETMLLFDTEERMAAFMEEASSFVAMPGHVYFAAIAGRGVQIALNLDVAVSSTVFDAETVDHIAAVLAEDEIADVDDLSSLVFQPPRAASEALLTALSARLGSAAGAVIEAWLFEIADDGEAGDAEEGAEESAEGDRLALGLVIEQEHSAVGEALGRELARLAGSIDPEGMDVALLAPGDALLEKIRAVGVGLMSKAA